MLAVVVQLKCASNYVCMHGRGMPGVYRQGQRVAWRGKRTINSPKQQQQQQQWVQSAVVPGPQAALL